MLIIAGKWAWQSGNCVGFGVISLGLLIARFYVLLGSQMHNILDAQLFIYKMVMQLPTSEVYFENIKVLL